MVKETYICYGTSNEYAEYTGISLLSALQNNPNMFAGVIILDYGLDARNKENFTNISKNSNINILFVETTSKFNLIKSRLDIPSFRGSMATYSRAFIDYFIPETVHRVLYVDSDTVVCGSFEELLDLDMNNVPIAAAKGVNQYSHNKTDNRSDEVKELLSMNKIYYAMGVVLFDMDNWRARRCHDMIETTCLKMSSFRYAEQSLINNALPEELFMSISLKFNYWGHLFNKNKEYFELSRGNLYTKDEIIDAIDNFVVIHYKGEFFQRPWFDKCASRRVDVWRHYKKISPWRDFPLSSYRDKMKSLNTIQRAKIYNYMIHFKYSNPVFRIASSCFYFIIMKICK